MNEEYYRLLGLDESATDEEVKARYEELLAKYKEERWLEGEAGNHAAKMINKVETAYKEIMEERSERESNGKQGGYNALEEVARLLKAGELDKAQSVLDAFDERGAEWHYLQAVVYYKKNWYNDSKKQLELAMQIDPDNAKYREAYEKLKEKNDYQQKTEQPNQTQEPNYNPQTGGEQMGGNCCSNCCTCCYAYMCVDCLFSCCCR